MILTDIDVPRFPDVDENMLLSMLRAAALRGGEVVRVLWEQRARELRIRHTGAYVRGIAKEARIVVENEIATEQQYAVIIAVTNTARHASIVEDGHEAFHLPERINWASADGKIKRRKDGSPYLIIPMRHFAFVAEADRASADGGGSGATAHALRHMMPREVYREARQLERSYGPSGGAISEVRAAPPGGVGQAGRHIREGQPYRQHLAAGTYNWARGQDSRLTRPAAFHRPGQIIGGAEPWVETRGPRGDNPAWKGSKFEGMRRMGPAGHTTYMTWRVITPQSQGWHIPAQPGHHVAAQVASVAPAALGPFVERQLAQLLTGGGLS